MSIIDNALSYHDIRESLEMLIYENADTSRNKKCVVKAIEVDEILVELTAIERLKYPNRLIMGNFFSVIFEMILLLYQVTRSCIKA